MDTANRTHRTLLLALLVEGGLGVVAFAIGWLVGHWPAVGMGWASPAAGEQLRAVGLGVVATLPPLVALAIIDRIPIAPLDRVRQIAEQAIREMFPQPRLWQLALVAATAGLGEELLFRGLVQAGLARLIGGTAGVWIALVAAALLFGIFHWLSTTYALLAALAGLYFGWLLIATGSLWPPIVAHALYDFVALWYLLRPNKMLGLRV
ncbi:MAG: CPBP family intramembrane metalloprotease [Planctomycetaceae bacterium]|nr:CPBP family intramembrane metalloprotease [Planctomycetaceae bacterium]